MSSQELILSLTFELSYELIYNLNYLDYLIKKVVNK